MDYITRKSFLGMAGAAAVVAAGGAFAGSALAAGAVAPSVDEVTWDEQRDIVVVGAGGAGYLAAFAAKDAGADVVVLEKMGATGGDTIISDQCPIVRLNDAFQQQLGQEDPLDLYVSELRETFSVSAMGLKGAEQPAEAPFLERYGELAPQMLDFAQQIGLEFMPLQLNGTTTAPLPPTDTVARFVFPTSGNIILPLRDAADAAGLEVVTDTEVVKVYRDADGRAAGVAAYDFSDQTVKYYGASKAVILATGTFCGNRSLMGHYLNLGAAFPGGAAGATGDGVLMAVDAGAALRDMDLGSHWLPYADPTDAQTLLTLENTPRDADGNAQAIPAIVVNFEGKRFVAESMGYSRVSEAIFGQTYHKAYIVCDSKGAQQLADAGANPFQADTLEGLASYMQVDAAALAAEVERFNGFVDAGADEDFGAYLNGAVKIEDGPFYAERIAPRVYYTYGGVKVDLDGHVLDDADAAIPGLYAAGAVCGSFAEQEGVFYQGGLGQALSFGMQAGQNAAAEA